MNPCMEQCKKCCHIKVCRFLNEMMDTEIETDKMNKETPFTVTIECPHAEYISKPEFVDL